MTTPTNYKIWNDFNCHINKRETPKTCLTNHKGSILHHIMPLVINSLGADTHTSILTSWTKAILRNPPHTWFKNIAKEAVVHHILMAS